MGKRLARVCISLSMALTGKVAPMIEKLSAAHNEQMLIDIRREGASPKAKAPNPCAASTVSMFNASRLHAPPKCGK